MSRLKDLIELGFLIDEEIKEDINNISDENYTKLVEDLKKDDVFLVSKENLKKLSASEVRILKEFKKPSKLNIGDFVKMLNEKYNTLQSILVEKINSRDIVSINKCGDGNVIVIGMIKTVEEKEKNFIISIEDPTGEIQVSVLKDLEPKFSLDDVIAVSGKIVNKTIFAEKIIYPDVPLRPVNYSREDVEVAFVSEEWKGDSSFIVTDRHVKDRIKDKVYNFTVPAFIEIDNIKILILFDYDPIQTLRKRFLQKENTDFILDIVPDIILHNKDINKNYKGITIIGLNSIINLKTREVKPTLAEVMFK